MRLQVAAAIIENQDGEVLLAERPVGKRFAGLWEFPGGKIEGGESVEEALARELQEELHLDVRIEEFIGRFAFDYPEQKVELHVFRVTALGRARATDDVAAIRWLKAEQIREQELTPADVEPLREFLRRKSSASVR